MLGYSMPNESGLYTLLMSHHDKLGMIILQDESTGEITFYMKGADVVMAGIVQYNDWLEEEVDFLLFHET